MKPRIKRSPLERSRRFARYLYLKFIRLRAQPKEIARGLAVGVFAGMFPLFGLQTIIGVALAAVIKGNPLMAAAGTWISNPLTYVPIYAFNYQLGSWILPGDSRAQPFTDIESLKAMLELQVLIQTGTDIAINLMLGSLIMGLIFGILSYFVGLPIIRRAQNRYRKLKDRQAA